MKSNKFWLITFGVLIISCITVIFFLQKTPASYANIYHNNILIDSVDLSNTNEIWFRQTVNNAEQYNQILVEDGRIRIQAANCPDKFCIHQGWVSSGLIPIVCLPHRLVIQLQNNKNNDYDAIVG
ncbi:MAG: NusG domain II-containing protein [Oscillospiraceae bacterium]|jgi:hypothetical protein|nr:NusG domain II-containing protein [Oscillospiraceae bacterium]